MAEIILLVDFENVKDVDLTLVPSTCHVRIFVGKSQNSIPFTLTNAAQPLGDRLQWSKINGDGKNNLDFHLAFYLGHLAFQFSDAEFVVLSKDKGFDPLIGHLVTMHLLRCRRIASLEELSVQEPQAKEPNFDRAYAVLVKIEKKSRPRKRKTLAQHIGSTFQKKLSSEEIGRMVDALFAKGLVSEVNGALTYNF